MLYVIAFVVCILLIIYKYLNSNYDYWKKLNIPFHPPIFFFGNLRDVFFLRKSLGQTYTDIYNSYKNVPYVGFYKIRQPGLIIRDADIIKDIMVKDFNNFQKNDIEINEKVDPISAKNPFFQYGAKWKVTRNQLSICFSSGKIKSMFPLIHEVSKNLAKYLEKECENGGNPFDTKELSSKFTTDNVATCAFGLNGKSFEDPDAEFRKVGKEVLNPSFFLALKIMCIALFPSSSKILNIKFIPDRAANYFRSIIKNTLQYRKENNIVRNDFLDTVNQMKFKPSESNFGDDDVVAHAISFFGDGFETSSIALSFALYELAANPAIQEELRCDIMKVLENHGGNINYDAIQEMNYLDCVLSESLRKHPPTTILTKVCTSDYKLPPCYKNGKEFTVAANTPIVIPTYGLHHDPKYFPNPERFDPDRFSEKNKSNIIKGSYLPFGEGPRLCPGMRFAVLQVKIAIVAIIKDFDIRVNKKTKEPLEIDPKHFLLLPIGGLWLDYYPRKK